MNPPKKRTPEEAWSALEEVGEDDEVERVLRLSDEALDRELADAGVDAKEVRERGRAIAGKLSGAGKGEPGAPLARVAPFRRARWAVLMAAALGSISLAVVGGVEAVGRSPHRDAAALRAKASGECAGARWKACLDDLNAARALDPAVDEDVTVRETRRAAEAVVKLGDGG